MTELERIAKDCVYGEPTGEMIRDRIVCGTNNPEVKEKLLQVEELAKVIVIQGNVKHGRYKNKRERIQGREQRQQEQEKVAPENIE